MADVRHTQSVMSSGQDLDAISPTPTTVNEYLSDLEVMHQKFHSAVAAKQQRKAGNTPSRSQASSQSVPTTPGADDDEDNYEDDEDWEKGDDVKSEKRNETRKESSTPSEKTVNKAVADLIRDYQPQVIHSLHPRTLHGKSLRDLHGLCDGTSQKGMALIRSLHRHYSRSSTVLALEAFDVPSSSLLTVGQCVMLNFNFEVDKYANKVSHHDLEKASSTGNLPAFLHHHSAPTTNNNSSSGDDSSSYSSPYSASPHDEEVFGSEVSSTTNGQPSSLQSEAVPAANQVSLDHDESTTIPDVPTSEEKHGSHRLKLSAPTINFFSSYLWPTPVSQQTIPGKGLLELRAKYAPWLRHAVYSILRGRPVIVWGSIQNESTVRGVVQALSVFVPGANSGISPWRTKPLKMSDLASFKLAGLARSCAIPKAVEKYVTIFDIENETLKAPPYPNSGKFIDEIFALKKYWPDELSYLAHVHYVMFDIGAKSCLYYHMCCVTVHQLTPQQVSQAQAYVHPYPRTHPHAHHSHGHSHSHTHSHSSHGHSQHSHAHHPSLFMPHQPPQPLRAVSPQAQPHRPPAHYYSQPPSPRIQQTSPHPSQPPSPYHSQPPSPRQPSQSQSQPPSPLIIPPNAHISGEPKLDTRVEPLRLDKSQELAKPQDTKTEPPKAETKPESGTVPRRKGTIGSLQGPVRSHSMNSIPDKLRPHASSSTTTTTTTPSNNTNYHNITNTNVSVFNTTLTNTTTGMLAQSNAINNINININSSGGIPLIPNSHHSGGSADWRSNSNTSPSSSRHASWQYGKSIPMQGHRSLSDSQINPAWLPPSADKRDQNRADFFKKMEIPPGDAEIVMYMAEVVKEQQASEVQGTESAVIRLDYSTCHLFHSKATKEAAHGRR